MTKARDISKLSAVEVDATADQTNAEVKAAAEAASDSNTFTDADHSKLNAIEASADVTDTANVTSSGALMDSELTNLAAVKAINQSLVTTASPTFAGVIVDNITIDGTEIDSSGVLTLDAAGQLNLDSGNSEIHLKGQGTLFAKHYVSSGDYYVNNPTQDGDVYITGQRAAGVVTALKFDMSDGGAATFSSSIKTGQMTLQHTQLTQSVGDFVMDVAGDIILDADGGDVLFKDGGTHFGSIYTTSTPSHMYIQSIISGQSLLLATVGGVALTIDSSKNATFAGVVGINKAVNSVVALSVGADTTATNSYGLEVTNASANTRFLVDGVGSSFFYKTDNAVGMKFDSSTGNVGIGSSSPQLGASWNKVVHVHSTAGLGSHIRFTDTTSGETGESGLYIGQYGNDSYIINRESGVMKFTNNGAERFRIASDGSLSTPTLGTSNVRFGVNAGNSIASGGNYNTVVGDEAGTAITTGDANTFHGYSAGAATTTSSDNTAIGGAALATNILASSNTAVGKNALYTHNVGSAASTYNTAIGHHAGLAITTGTLNTLVGGLAGDAITTGYSNVALGYLALSTDTLGATSIAIGTEALKTQNFTTATTAYNVAIGDSAGKLITTGTDNTLIGGLTGDALTTGFNNVAMGKLALSTEDTGRKNVAIGFSALEQQNSDVDNFNVAVGFYAGGAVTTGVQNTFVGGLAGDSTDDGAYNTAVGYQALSANCSNENTAVGWSALTSSTVGENTACGSAAGYSLTTGTYGTFVGRYAGVWNTTADGSTFVGHLAGQGITGAKLTGNNNTAVGRDAGLLLQGAATQNTLIGGLAGDAITTASNSTALGYLALSAAQTSGQNTAIGSLAGDAITGSNNTAVGYSTNRTTTTGVQNTLVGASVNVDAAGSNNCVGMGFNITAAAGYTTFGIDAADIRAAHGTATWAAVSDERYKKDIVDSTAGLSFINALKPRTFKYKTLGELPEAFRAYKADSTEVFKNSDTNHGFIAQEVKTAIDADSGIKDGFKLWAERDDGGQELAEAALIPMLTKAVQELSTALDAALARIATLEA